MRREDHKNYARSKTRSFFASLPLLRVLWGLWVLPALSLHMGGCHEYHAQRQLDKGRYKSALEHLDRTNKKKPYLRALALKGLKRYEEAYKAALDEVRRYQNRSRGPVKPFILAAELAHQLDYAQECLELLEMARSRGNLKTQHKVIEALRRLDRAEHLLSMGAVVTPTEDVTRAIGLIHDMGIKVPSSSGSHSNSGSHSSSGSHFSSGSVPGTSNSSISSMSKERLENIAYQAWTSSAIWAFAMNKKSEALKWLSKPSTAAEKRVIKGKGPEALIPARRGLKALLTTDIKNNTNLTDITSAVSLMEKLGAHEAVVKGVNAKVGLTEKGAPNDEEATNDKIATNDKGGTNLDPSTAGSRLTLIEKGLRSAQKTWNRRASWELQKNLATLAEHTEESFTLTERTLKILTAECLYWEDSFSPACRSLERIAVKRRAEKHWQQSPQKHEAHVRYTRKLILKALRLKEGPVAVFRKLEEDALTWVTRPMTLAEFEKRVAQNISEFSGYEKPLALIWMHRLETHLKEHIKAKSRAPGKTTAQEDRGSFATQGGPSDAQGNSSVALKISTKDSLLRVNLLKVLSKAPKKTLLEWFLLLYLRSRESLKQSALVNRWTAQLPTKQHRELLFNLLGSIAASPESTSLIKVKAREMLITSAAKTSLELAYYKAYSSRKAGEKEESKGRGAKKKSTQKPKGSTKQKQRTKLKQPSPEERVRLKNARKRGIQLVEKLDNLSKKELKTPVCSLASNSPTLWQARILVLLEKPQKAKDTLLLAIRTGPKGFGLCRVSSVLSHLQELGLSAEKPAHHIASSFHKDPQLLRPAALALVRSPNSGWADLAGEDLIAASPDGGRVLLKLSRAYLKADRCGQAGKLGIKVFQWVSPSLPAHAPAVRLIAGIFARCDEMDRLYAHLKTWRKTQHQTELRQDSQHTKNKRTSGIPKGHTFNRALRIVVKELADNGLEKEALEISRHFGGPNPNKQVTSNQVNSRSEGSRLHARKDSPPQVPQVTDSLHKAEKDFKLNPLDPLAACRLAELLIEKQAYKKADSLLNKALLLNPSAYCAQRLMAQLAIEEKNYRAAEEWLAWLIVTNRKSLKTPNPEKEGDARRELAELYLKLDKPSAAVRLYRKALSDPTSSMIQKRLALKSLWNIVKVMLPDTPR